MLVGVVHGDGHVAIGGDENSATHLRELGALDVLVVTATWTFVPHIEQPSRNDVVERLELLEIPSSKAWDLILARSPRSGDAFRRREMGVRGARGVVDLGARRSERFERARTGERSAAQRGPVAVVLVDTELEIRVARCDVARRWLARVCRRGRTTAGSGAALFASAAPRGWRSCGASSLRAAPLALDRGLAIGRADLAAAGGKRTRNRHESDAETKSHLWCLAGTPGNSQKISLRVIPRRKRC